MAIEGLKASTRGGARGLSSSLGYGSKEMGGESLAMSFFVPWIACLRNEKNFHRVSKVIQSIISLITTTLMLL